jgi:hypothetical protein
MKKVLIGVGIGCGALVLLGVIATVVGGFWLKSKMGDAVASVQQLQAQEQEMQALEQSYPYTPPPPGEVRVLQESRLLDYLAVREAALPVFQEFEKKTQDFQQRHQDDETPDFGAAMKAAGMATELITRVRAAYIQGLKQHRMSPREFHTITRTLYASFVSDTMEEAQLATARARFQTEQTLDDLRARLEDETLSDQERAILVEQEEMLAAQLDALFPEEALAADGPALSEKSKAAATANMALLEKHKASIENVANLAFDGFLIGGYADGNSLVEDFQ